ncbi:MAG: hypothetical protein AMS27_12680 [Bacteroides sp. SM23_62_1]|nr:MAG: hypothetical protein AMS27_12680 [Bacteroides sp. SM23_62_1]
MKKIFLLVLFSYYFSFIVCQDQDTKGLLFDPNNPQITEIMALNSSVLQDEDGDYSDWLEIHNPTSTSVNLQGWFLTDDAGELNKWKIPAVTLNMGAYLIIFASGKNRIDPSKNLHTNFKLSGSGEYLALIKPDGQTVVFSFGERFPTQYPDISYGLLEDNFVFFNTPTPGSANSTTLYLPPPEFNLTGGFLQEPFDLVLSTSVSGGVILYTTDCSEPDKNYSDEYILPFPVTKTTIVRAAVYKEGYNYSNSITHTYIFPDDVINQPNNPEGYPSQWGPYSTLQGYAPADYEMDPDICEDPAYSGLMTQAFLSVPTISIVTEIDNLFSSSPDSTTGGIYIFTGPPTGYSYFSFPEERMGEGWERPASVEFIIPNSPGGFQENCGLRLQGGHSRLPEKNPKHSFRLVFKSQYGKSKLEYPLFEDEGAVDRFNTITLRAGFGNTWLHWTSIERTMGHYARDTWSKDTQLAMGQPAAHNRFVHLFLNGLYWGLYNPSERIDREFMESYFGGNEEDYDVIKDFTEIVDGNLDAWNQMMTLANAGLTDNTSYQRIQGNNPDGTQNPSYPNYLDVENLIDYMIMNIYGGNTDWDHHNWAAARNRREPGKGFKFFSWDAEHILKDPSTNVVDENNDNCPSRLFQKLRENPEFCLLFADHVNHHFFNGGALTPEAAAARLNRRAEEIELPMICESARWGDYRRDVHQWQYGPFDLYTKNDYWQVEHDRLMNDYFPVRTDIVLNQLKETGLYPYLDAPRFSKHGGFIDPGFELTMTNTSGTIYYTMDETDPRLTGGEVSKNAQIYNSDAVILHHNLTVKARSKSGAQWSALTEAYFYTDSTTDITHYETNTFSDSYGSFPNPFNTETNIFYSLPEGGDIDIAIYSIDGRQITTLYSGYQPAGEHTVVWHPDGLESGIYFYMISSQQFKATGKLLFIR